MSFQLPYRQFSRVVGLQLQSHLEHMNATHIRTKNGELCINEFAIGGLENI